MDEEEATIMKLLSGRPDQVCDLVMQLRELVHQAVPQAHEVVRLGWKALCYCRDEGVIKGGVCMIVSYKDRVHLAFTHGAHLPDPQGLLEGTGKSMRHIKVPDSRSIRKTAFKKLIREAIKYHPSSG